ncbi:MAG: hypothetical protein ABIV51_12295 [Saprospiraceae bacterium]
MKNSNKILLFTLLFLSSIDDMIAKDAPGFVENKGQISYQDGSPASDILFTLTLDRVRVDIKRGSVHYTFYQVATDPNSAPVITNNPKANIRPTVASTDVINSYRLDMEFLGSNGSPEVVGQSPSQFTENFYLQNCGERGVLQVKRYESVLFKSIYPGIDLLYQIKDGELKYDFIVQANVDPSQIRWQYKGATALDLDAKGDITIHSALGELTEKRPFCYQKATGQFVPCAYVNRDGVISFDMGVSDHLVVIDPSLEWATYYGGLLLEFVEDMKVDVDGSNY